MEDENSAHYALEIAVKILRERCQLFQNRITVLEEENVNLKSLCQKNNSNQSSLSQIDSFKLQIAAVEEQNSQLQTRIKIISQENQQLWENLGKLTHMNRSLGTHLNKINNTLSQHASRHQPLIRSKTFTQEKPINNDTRDNLKKVDNRLDLEDISLKLMNSMSEIKSEIDSLSRDMDNVEILDNIITSSLGFNYDDEENDIVEDLKIILEELQYVKNESEKQNGLLKQNLENVRNLKANPKCDECLKNNYEKMGETIDPVPNNSNKTQQKNIEEDSNDTRCNSDKICPVCSRQFSETHAFSLFLDHVETHFRASENDY